MELFTDSQIKVLREEFAKIQTVNADRLGDFHETFDKMTDKQLVQIAKAEIKFLSKLAVNACVRRGIELDLSKK